MDLGDAVADFAKTHTGVLPELMLGGMNPKSYDFIDQGFDVAIHTRSIPNSRIKAKRIATDIIDHGIAHHLGLAGMGQHPADDIAGVIGAHARDD